MATTDYDVLNAFVVDNPDLERLETILAEFNIFEALGAIHQELRHSDFLAFLMDPSRNHGLGDAFLKRFLKRVLADANTAPIRAVEIDVADLDSAVVRREWNNIDILVEDDVNRLVFAIENKIDSGEHGGQLQRYRSIVRSHFPGYRSTFLYLTPEGDDPSDDAYLPVSYDTITQLVEVFSQTHASTLGPDVRTLMNHYAVVLRRYVVSESQIADLCRRLYRQHRQALDLIFEYRPDTQWELHEILQAIVRQTDEVHNLALDHSTKSAVRFAVRQWDEIPAQITGNGWTPSNRLMLFEFFNHADRLALALIVGPGPDEVRRVAIKAFREDPQLFRYAHRAIGKRHNTVYVRRILSRRDFEDNDVEALEGKIKASWTSFLRDDLPKIETAVSAIAWPTVTQPEA